VATTPARRCNASTTPKGRLRSGNTITKCFDAAYSEFDKGVEAALGALGVAEERGVLDSQQLRETTERLLAQFINDMENACKAPLFRQWGSMKSEVLDEKEGEFDKKVAFALRQFDVGHLNLAGPEVPASISNAINVENMIGSVVQQGTRDSTQNASITINIAAVRNALDSLEKTLSEYPAPQRSPPRSSLNYKRSKLSLLSRNPHSPSFARQEVPCGAFRRASLVGFSRLTFSQPSAHFCRRLASNDRDPSLTGRVRRGWRGMASR